MSKPAYVIKNYRKKIFAELYFKTKSFIFIVRTHFYGEVVFIVEEFFLKALNKF